jgi:hypothetical protein
MLDSENPFLKDIAIQFERILDSAHEQEIHAFLETHPQLFNFLQDRGILKSKFRLADAFIPDFISIGADFSSNSLRSLITFVEIERSNMPLFTKSGDPTSGLTHAIRQVQNWKQWVTNNRMYMQQVFAKITTEELAKANDGDSWVIKSLRGVAHGFSDRYLVIAGRRNTMSVPDRILLSQMNDDLHGIKIITYDVLLEWLLSSISGADDLSFYHRHGNF